MATLRFAVYSALLVSCSKAFGFAPIAGSLRRSSRVTTPRMSESGTFNQEADINPHLLLSGAWTLATESTEDPFTTAWDPEKKKFETGLNPFDQSMVTLASSGKFTSAAGETGEVVLDGRWSVKGNELEVAIFGIAHTIKRWYVGTISEDGKFVEGFVGEGNIDPEWTGKFTLAMLMPHFQKATIVRNPPAKNPVYEHEQFHGAWRIETWRYGQTLLPRDVMLRDQMAGGAEALSKGKNKRKYGKRGVPPPMLSSSTVFDVVLHPDGTWETTSGMGDGKLAGKWNLFSKEIDLTTGIKGRGHRIYLSVRRFKTMGGAWSTGVAMTADNLYMGKVLLDVVGPDADVEAQADLTERLGAADRAPGATDAAGATGTAGAVVDAEVEDVVAEGAKEKKGRYMRKEEREAAEAEAEERRLADKEKEGMRVAMKVMGYVCEGFAGEPSFHGRFNMTRVQLSHE
mmetsp:Transcript_21110/g.54493  ORF Transcript_21110/g.54493 Transcript_21110/m.54493 type:complete len:457 (+) Transcript_21110:1013-2383(+)|eukprot:CAMPEP_0119471384 /NCGR_PEP_ID=MMETSP1344-20130328/3872_1 /TAXON_ID=236787 /ORGANISM="Florenciella parvula, Strain CCMP2471" /LENGTH=456 /DNA_ID=CAMNT_0007504161 /DNA_START=384 /DNA_END=1754 /DNA_ORIENTATION=-